MSSHSAIAIEPVVLTKTFNAPRQLVFDAWTKVEHLQKWIFPQKGFSVEFKSADIRAGGSAHHKMITPNGYEMWLLTRYDEIHPPERIVFRQYISNEAGDIFANATMPNAPKEMRATVLLDEVDGKTTMKFIWEPVNPTKEEAEAFAATRSQQGNGWGGGFDHLGVYIESL